MTNPNRVRALYGSFFHRNPLGFHQEDGSGYDYCANVVADLDKRNPQIASRIARALIDWRKYDHKRQKMMQKALKQLADQGLSADTFEIIQRAK